MVNSLYTRVSRKRVCSICGKPDWCSYSPDGKISFCARINNGADRVSRTGWGVYYHDGSPQLLRQFPSPIPYFHFRNKHKSTSAQSPIWVKDFVYRKLIELAPASNSDDIISGPKGLSGRQILDVENYGSLPQSVSERSALAEIIADMVRGHFPGLVKKRNTAIPEIPGFWTDERGWPRLWRNKDYAIPMMVIPYRDTGGLIQGCQIRFMGSTSKKHPRYVWLSTPEKSNEGGCGTPLHFARYNSDSLNKPLLVTEGALKAETVKAFAKSVDIIASGGVTCSHDQIISAGRFRSLLIGFDADKTHNRNVARALASLLCLRLLDREKHGYDHSVRILMWTSAVKGIDDAFLQNVPISQAGPREWFDALNRSCRSEVERCFKQNGGTLAAFGTYLTWSENWAGIRNK